MTRNFQMAQMKAYTIPMKNWNLIWKLGHFCNRFSKSCMCIQDPFKRAFGSNLYVTSPNRTAGNTCHIDKVSTTRKWSKFNLWSCFWSSTANFLSFDEKLFSEAYSPYQPAFTSSLLFLLLSISEIKMLLIGQTIRNCAMTFPL